MELWNVLTCLFKIDPDRTNWWSNLLPNNFDDRLINKTFQNRLASELSWCVKCRNCFWCNGVDTEILKDNVYIIFLFSNVPVMAEKRCILCIHSSTPRRDQWGAWACCNVCRSGSWMHLGEGMPSCPASYVTALERRRWEEGAINTQGVCAYLSRTIKWKRHQCFNNGFGRYASS